MRRRPCRAAVAMALATVAAFALTASAATAHPSTRPSANVTAYVAPHRLLPDNPVLHAGQSVQIVVTGFAARAQVTVQQVHSRYLSRLRADGLGVVRAAYVVPAGRSGGQYLITFQGQPSVPRGARPRVVEPQVARGADRRTVIVTIPRIGLFPYRLAGGPGGSDTGGVSVHVPADDPGSSLAVTGADIVGAALLAMLAVVAGGPALRLGRRRP